MPVNFTLPNQGRNKGSLREPAGQAHCPPHNVWAADLPRCRPMPQQAVCPVGFETCQATHGGETSPRH